MTKIEYIESETEPDKSGWWILDFATIGEEPYERTGPYLTRLKALEAWRGATLKPAKREREPSDARQED